jgi:hypothetical protein
MQIPGVTVRRSDSTNPPLANASAASVFNTSRANSPHRAAATAKLRNRGRLSPLPAKWRSKSSAIQPTFFKDRGGLNFPLGLPDAFWTGATLPGVSVASGVAVFALSHPALTKAAQASKPRQRM